MSITRVTDRYKLTQALVVDPLYLQHSYSESAIDYRVGISKIHLSGSSTRTISALGHSA